MGKPCNAPGPAGPRASNAGWSLVQGVNCLKGSAATKEWFFGMAGEWWTVAMVGEPLRILILSNEW